MPTESPSGKEPKAPDIPVDDGKPYGQVVVLNDCPFPEHAGQQYVMLLGWVNREFPMVHIDGGTMLEHLRAEHQAT